MKVMFVEARAKRDVLRGLEREIGKLQGYRRVGLLSTVQFANQLSKVRDFLKSKDIEGIIRKPSGSAVLEGQILGCDVSAALSEEADCFLYIGTGNFHPCGLLAKTGKPVFTYNPFTERLCQMSGEEKLKMEKRKAQRMAKLKDARTIGILVSAKPGQYLLQGPAERIKEELEAEGKTAYIFICDQIRNSELADFGFIEGWVNTACPRLAEDFFDKPVVNASDLQKA